MDEDVQIEVRSSAARARYIVALLKSCYPYQPLEKLRVLDIGCGVGAVVEQLSQVVGESWGIDPGWRGEMWKSLRVAGKLLVATGEALPFPSDCFDFCSCFGVVEHVGCSGWAMNQPTADCQLARVHFAHEAMRVLKAGGHALISCPNRLFPLDFWHSDSLARLHSPWDQFLLSYGDLRRLFLPDGGGSIQALPQSGFFGFGRFDLTAKGKAQMLRRLATVSLKILDRSQFLLRYATPHLVVLVTKGK
jgi:SAM-dependent methyltransferase